MKSRNILLILAAATILSGIVGVAYLESEGSPVAQNDDSNPRDTSQSERIVQVHETTLSEAGSWTVEERTTFPEPGANDEQSLVRVYYVNHDASVLYSQTDFEERGAFSNTYTNETGSLTRGVRNEDTTYNSDTRIYHFEGAAKSSAIRHNINQTDYTELSDNTDDGSRVLVYQNETENLSVSSRVVIQKKGYVSKFEYSRTGPSVPNITRTVVLTDVGETTIPQAAWIQEARNSTSE